MKKITLYFSLFALVTILSVSSLIVIMIDEYQNLGRRNVEEQQVVTEQNEKINDNYWTQERMKEAEPAPMPTVESNYGNIKEIVTVALPFLMVSFIIFTFWITFMNFKKIKSLEEQSEKLWTELAKVNREIKSRREN